MRPFPRGSRARTILILLVLTAISLMTLDTRGVGPVGTMRGAVMAVFSPFRSAADWVLSPVTDIWHGIANFSDVEAENAALQERVAELEGQVLRGEASMTLLERLLEQTEIEFGADIEQVAARVISGPAGPMESTVTINKGSDHGIEEGMAVVTGAGLVGRIERVTASESVVMLVTDPRMRVGARVVRTQDVGRLEGSGSSRPPELSLSSDADLVEGDILMTSGITGSVYPPDIPIGRVLAVVDEPEETTDTTEVDEDDTTATTTGGQSVIPELGPVTDQRVEVELAARLDRLNFLTVLLWVPGR